MSYPYHKNNLDKTEREREAHRVRIVIEYNAPMQCGGVVDSRGFHRRGPALVDKSTAVKNGARWARWILDRWGKLSQTNMRGEDGERDIPRFALL